MRDTYREEARHNKAYGVQLTSPEQIHFSQNDMYQEESFEEPIVTSYGTYNRSRVILPHNEFSNASLCDTPDFLGIPRSTWIASQGPNANGRSELDRDATTYTNPGPRWFPKDDRTYHFAINLLLPPKSSQDYTCKKLVGQVIQLAALTGTRASRPLAEWIPKKVDETILIRKARGTDLDTIYITLLSFSCTSSDPTKGWEESKVRIVGRINGKLVVNVFWLFYLRTWADFGVPSNTKEFAEFILRVHSGPGCDRPKLVHCAAGVGRTGAFITIASLVDLLAFFFRSPIVAEQLLEAFATRAKRRGSQLPAPLLRDPIAFTVNFLRDYRSGMVQRENQFKDLYQVARELFAKWNEDPRLAPVPKTWLSVHG
ncbi:phosphatases II [Meredithblackwellia eburnea MCA 4105]